MSGPIFLVPKKVKLEKGERGDSPFLTLGVQAVQIIKRCCKLQ